MLIENEYGTIDITNDVITDIIAMASMGWPIKVNLMGLCSC